MKNRFAFLAVVMMMGTAVAAGKMVKRYTLAATNAVPNATQTTIGIPLREPVTGAFVKSLSVTVMDHRDGGGSNHEDVEACVGRAYRQVPQQIQPDGGVEWVRVPELDFTCPAPDGGPVAAGFTFRFANVDGVSGGGGRLYYQTTGVAALDAGTLVHEVIIEGTY